MRDVAEQVEYLSFVRLSVMSVRGVHPMGEIGNGVQCFIEI